MSATQRDEGPPILIATGVALVLFPVLVLALSAPIWAGLLIAVGVGACAGVLGGVVRLPASLPLPSMARGSPTRAALNEAEEAATRVALAAERIRRPSIQAHTRAIAQAGAGIVADVRAEPTLLAAAQRVITYYLPRAADLAEAYAVLEESGAHTERRAALEAVLAKLAEALAAEEARLHEGDLKALDAEIRLVQSALKDDFG